MPQLEALDAFRLEADSPTIYPIEEPDERRSALLMARCISLHIPFLHMCNHLLCIIVAQTAQSNRHSYPHVLRLPR